MRFVTACVLLLAVVFIVTDASEWTYKLLCNDWTGECRSGRRQSPIYLSKKIATQILLPKLKFENYDREVKSLLGNNGHTVEILINEKPNTPTLKGGNLAGEYLLDNVHFHWGSEHVIEDERYPLEAHFVHYKKEYGNVTNAGSRKDGVVVLGVVFEIGSKNKDFQDVIDCMEKVSRTVNAPIAIKDDFKPECILPKKDQRFYMYQGSLTTPDCNEVVTWIVFDQPVTLSKSQYTLLINIETDSGELLTHNYRPLQNINGREILYSGG